MPTRPIHLTIILVVVVTLAGCNSSWKFECRDEEPYLNGREFDCGVYYEEQGCVLDGSNWECPIGANLTCLMDESEGQYCCGDDCIDCSGSSTPQVCEGYSGSDTDCCRDDDPCDLQRNASCDCEGACGWDTIDCEGLAVDVLVVMDNSMSTDMGTGGFMVGTCSDPVDGDNGVLLHTPNPALTGCDSTYPAYLNYDADSPSPTVEEMTTGFDCIATLGTSGCGWEQHLEASSRALEHTLPGGPNEGFMRPGSILMIVFVTDEEDCSVADPAIFNSADSTLGHLNLRCYLHPYMVHPVDRYIEQFHGQRADPDFLILGVLAGVPPDPVCEGYGDEVPNCLSHPDMVEEIDPSDPTRLSFSCNTATGYAFPPRRLVQVAQAFGPSAVVGSICTDDYSAFVDRLIQRIRHVTDG